MELPDIIFSARSFETKGCWKGCPPDQPSARNNHDGDLSLPKWMFEQAVLSCLIFWKITGLPVKFSLSFPPLFPWLCRVDQTIHAGLWFCSLTFVTFSKRSYQLQASHLLFLQPSLVAYESWTLLIVCSVFFCWYSATDFVSIKILFKFL